MKRIMHLLSVADENISIMTGTDDILLTALFAGCVGSMTAFAAIYPNETAQLYDYFARGEYDKAWQIQKSFMPQLRHWSAAPRFAAGHSYSLPAPAIPTAVAALFPTRSHGFG